VRQRTAIASTIAMALMLAAACGTSPTSTVSSTGSPGSGASSQASAPPATSGTMVTTVDGYQFWLSVTKPATTSSDLKVLQGVRLSDSSVCYNNYYGSQCPELHDAPPGKDYIFAVVTVTNKTDRAEPLVVLIRGDLLFLLVPFGEFDKFGAAAPPGSLVQFTCDDTAAHNSYATPNPSTFCIPFAGSFGEEPLFARSLCLGTNLTVINQCDLAPGQSTAIYVFWGEPIPESAPTGDVHVYSFDNKSTGPTLTRIG
jgi:hypothetical protein